MKIQCGFSAAGAGERRREGKRDGKEERDNSPAIE